VNICEITSAQVSYNPRLVKEADALVEVGHEVHVVSCFLEDDKATLDKNLSVDRDWSVHPVRVRRGHGFFEHFRWLYASLRQALYQHVPWLRQKKWGRVRAYSRYVDQLAHEGRAIDADLYIAHNLPALPAAWLAASENDARLGFDAEDFHRGQFEPGQERGLKKSLTEYIEEEYMPQCDYITVAAPGIGKAYEEELDISSPTSILNVFPKTERDMELSQNAKRAERPGGEGVISLYWYSQVIGHDRGLQDAVRALGQLSERVHLSFRGDWEEGFQDELNRLAENEGVSHRVHRLEPVPPEELVARARHHDVGLALEQAACPNRNLCITNKILVYLLAGLPVVGTKTKGQAFIHEKVPEAVSLCEIGSPDGIAKGVQELAATKKQLQMAKERAWQQGQQRFNWETEQTKLLDLIAEVFGTA